jgi:hypothetical protein
VAQSGPQTTVLALATASSGNHAKQYGRWGEKKSENSRRETGLPKERSYPRLGAFLPAQKMTVNKKPNGFLEQIVLWHFRSAGPHECGHYERGWVYGVVPLLEGRRLRLGPPGKRQWRQ